MRYADAHLLKELAVNVAALKAAVEALTARIVVLEASRTLKLERRRDGNDK